ncbi:MAG: transglycosylase SLT domain-containing protein [Verrucomicrobia bacterium]|nr:transglycosylase SLT domain-containing protein [Verrucomicrobiota bacterium]
MLPFVADLPPLEQERIVCSISSALKYEVPANLVLAVAEKEGGKPGQWVRNTNGTHDVGPMQFNTAYLRELERYGITANDVATAGCYSFDLAAWRLRMHLRNDKGDIWTRAANYHSRTPQFNVVYRADLMKKAAKWADWLEARFVTLDVTKEGATPSTPTMKAAAAAAPAAPAPQPAPPRSARMAAYVPRQITFTSSNE